MQIDDLNETHKDPKAKTDSRCVFVSSLGAMLTVRMCQGLSWPISVFVPGWCVAPGNIDSLFKNFNFNILLSRAINIPY